MTKLIAQIRDDLIASDSDISTTLRRAKVLAASLRNPDFATWVALELEGYPSETAVPEYRRIHTHTLGSFSGPFGSAAKNIILPTMNLPSILEPFVGPIELRESARTLTAMARNDEGNLQRPWPAEAVMAARQSISMSGGLVLVAAWNPISIVQIDGAIDAIKNRLLDFLMRLQAIDPTLMESDKSLAHVSQRSVQDAFNLTIHGNNNIVASGENITQTVQTEVVPHDIESLVGYFKSLGAEAADTKDLRAAVEADGTRQHGSLGKRVKEWFGRMCTKIAGGAWKVGVATAPGLINNALAAYYGWSAK